LCWPAPSCVEAALFRDEMANVCWGVECRLLGAAGETVDRYLEMTRKPVTW